INVGKLAGFGLTLPAAELALAKPLPLLAGERIGSGVLLTDKATGAVEGAMAAASAEGPVLILNRFGKPRTAPQIAAVMAKVHACRPIRRRAAVTGAAHYRLPRAMWRSASRQLWLRHARS